MIASTGFAQLSSKSKDISNELFYLYLTSDSTIDRLQQIASSAVSAYPSISPNDILELKLALPIKIEIISTLGQLLESTFMEISIKQRGNQQLATLRDWLLPMLMNGQVTVKDEA